MYRIGQGFDVHGFAEGRQLIVGGVTIPHSKGLDGHSDADVLLHAIADACLGAVGLGDIGQHFPDNEPTLRGMDSKILLTQVCDLIHAEGFKVVNLDSIIIAQAPRMSPHIKSMCENVATCLKIPAASVNVKATTTEYLGFVGRQEGIAATATVLLTKT